MALPLLLMLALTAPPPPDWNYVFERPDAAIAGEEAGALGAKALGQIGMDTTRIESSHYGIALHSTLNFYQRPRLNDRICEQVVYQAEALRTRTETFGLPRETYLRAQASGDGYKLDRLAIWRQFARGDAKGSCPDVDGWVRAPDRRIYDEGMFTLEQVRQGHPAVVADFLKEPIIAVQRRGDVLTVEGYRRRLVMWLGINSKLDHFEIEEKGPPPLS